MAGQQADPLRTLKLVDLGTGMAGALVTRFLADAGAQVTRIEPVGGDPFYDLYPAYAIWHRGKTILSDDGAAVAAALADADACVIGGEDFPALDWHHDAEELARSYPQLVILDLAAYPVGTAGEGRPAVDLLVQARSGLAYEHYPDRPMLYGFPVASYGAALQGLVALMGALCEQRCSGAGQIARTSLYQGALTWLGHFWFSSDRTDTSFDFNIPLGTTPLIFRCADGKYVHFTMGTAGAKGHVYGILGIDDPTLAEDSRGLPSLARGLRNFYGDIDLLQRHIVEWPSADFLEALWAKGVPAEAVYQPGEGWGDPQVMHNGVIVEEEDGVRRVGLPARFKPEQEAGRRDAPRKAPDDQAALAGVRIVDFGNFTAGPHASMMLGDLGADVIKIEALAGDPLRSFYRPFTTSSRGKRNIAIDMKTPEGLEIVHRLCGRADIVGHNFRPGVTKRLGIDVDTLRAMKPDLVILENSGYGADGPKSGRGGIDMIFQAFCGHELHGAGTGNDPVSYRSTTMDFGAGVIGAISLLIAQYRKIETGAGAEISTSLLNTGLFLMSELFQHADGSFSQLPQLNHQQTGFHPAEQLYPARGGWLAIAARGEAMARRLLAVLDLSARIGAPRQDWGAEEEALIAGAIANRQLEELLETLAAKDIWAERCTENAETAFLADPELQALDIALCNDDPVYGRVAQIGRLFSLSRSHAPTSGASARLGQHTADILRELGYSESDIAAFFADRIVA